MIQDLDFLLEEEHLTAELHLGTHPAHKWPEMDKFASPWDHKNIVHLECKPKIMEHIKMYKFQFAALYGMLSLYI